jgi:hypothetical protein
MLAGGPARGVGPSTKVGEWVTDGAGLQCWQRFKPIQNDPTIFEFTLNPFKLDSIQTGLPGLIFLNKV